VFAIHDDLAALVDYFTGFDHATAIGALGVWLLFFNGDARVDRIADEHRFRKAQAVVSVSESDGIDLAGGEADSDGERHRAVGDALAEGSFARKFGVHVMWEIISGVAGVEDDIGFRNRAAGSISLGPDCVIFEVFRFRHGSASGTSELCFTPPDSDG
jgi:hypothetical protein